MLDFFAFPPLFWHIFMLLAGIILIPKYLIIPIIRWYILNPIQYCNRYKQEKQLQQDQPSPFQMEVQKAIEIVNKAITPAHDPSI